MGATAGGLTENTERFWADPAGFPPGTKTLANKVRQTRLLYPCFVHRDAEKQGAQKRHDEIAEAVQGVTESQPHIGVVPVHMTEAWLLLDEAAIRSAAGNPNSRMALKLPHKKRWESLADPKEVLHNALRVASGASAHGRRSFALSERSFRVADLINDWSALRGLRAFDRLEVDVRNFLMKRNQTMQEGMNL